MTESSISIKTSKPVPLLLKPVKLDYPKFFKAIFSGTKNLIIHDWSKVVSDSMDAAAALKLATTPEELAYTLLQRSITKALLDVVGETSIRILSENAKEAQSIEQLIEKTLGNYVLQLDAGFFDRPTNLEVLPILQKTLKTWLVAYGMSEASSENISKRLPYYFQAAVIDEWRKNSSRYSPILDVLNSPFAKAGDRELGWKNYDAYLQQQVERSVFDEAFSLAQIYIPLNAYFLEPRNQESKGNGYANRNSGAQTHCCVH